MECGPHTSTLSHMRFVTVRNFSRFFRQTARGVSPDTGKAQGVGYPMPVEHRVGRLGQEEKAMKNFGPVSVEEQVHGDTLWVALRARGAEWSWLTPEDALRLAAHWMAAYGTTAKNSMDAAPV
jgi:hypothetical protein